MDEIEVIIRIPEEWIEQFKAFKHPSTLETIILQGTVLPKGHGDLVDGSKVVDIVTEYVPDDDGSVGNTNLKDLLYEVENMERVIDADREVDNG